MSMSPTASKLLNSMPFRPEALESLNCKKDSNGDLTCEAGLTGAQSKTPLRIRGSDLSKIQCQRDASGALVCEVETPNGRERVIF